MVNKPIGYCGTVGELIDKLITLDRDAKLYISGDDYGNGASLLLEDFTPIIEV